MMKKYWIYSLFILGAVFNTTHIYSQRITVETKIDSTVIWIGEQTPFSLSVTQEKGQVVTFPFFSDTIAGGLDIVEPLQIDTLHENGQLTVIHKYVVTAFEDSLLYVPPFPVVVDGDTVWSNGASLKVIQPFEIDMEGNTITDIKDVFDPPFNWAGFFMIVLLVLLIAGLLVGIFFLVKKFFGKKQKATPPVLQPDLPTAYATAIASLNKIREEKLWQQNRLKEYYTELTDTLRVYLGRVYNINAMEMTSDEVLSKLGRLRKEQKEVYNNLATILQTADLVKFAKWSPLNDENELCLKYAFSFVEAINPEAPSVDAPTESTAPKATQTEN